MCKPERSEFQPLLLPIFPIEGGREVKVTFRSSPLEKSCRLCPRALSEGGAAAASDGSLRRGKKQEQDAAGPRMLRCAHGD